MDFLINRTNILDALTNENPKVMEDLGNLGRFVAWAGSGTQAAAVNG